jgi:hypothetical protein
VADTSCRDSLSIFRRLSRSPSIPLGKLASFSTTDLDSCIIMPQAGMDQTWRLRANWAACVPSQILFGRRRETRTGEDEGKGFGGETHDGLDQPRGIRQDCWVAVHRDKARFGSHRCCASQSFWPLPRQAQEAGFPRSTEFVRINVGGS